ncbi:MAG: hypothetical protein RLY49_468 [Candidatus Parcubacteria bacterium]|jgi:hypothetical protein
METKQNFESPQLTEKISNLEQELAFLRSQIIDKKSEHGIEQKTQEVVQTISNKKQEVYTDTFLHTPEQTDTITLDLKPEAHDETMASLIEIIKKHGIINAIEVVAKLQDAHINDDFHRFLVEYLKEGYPVFKKESEETLRPLKRTLFEVLIPKKEQTGENNQEHIHKMYSLISGLRSIADYSDEHITIEITNPVGEKHFSVYISVYEKVRDMFEKQMLSLFPSSKLVEQKNDFNIFVPLGSHFVYSAKLKELPVKPLKTSEEFQVDPLNTLVGVFTKLEQMDDAACVQFVIRPGKGFYTKNYAKALPKVEKGEKPDEIYMKDKMSDKLIYGTNKILKGIIETAASLQSESSSKSEDKKIDQFLVEGLRQKIKHEIYSVNIRVVTSSKEENRAKAIASEIKSSFDQFSNPTGNRIEWFEHKGDLKKELKKFIYRQFDMEYEMPLNISEISTIIHFPDESKETTAQFKRLGMTSAPAPFNLEQNQGVLLGTNEHAGEITNIRMQNMDRLRHMYVIGQTGTGKTTLLKNMIIQDIKNGEGVCMIDPHGSDIQEILAAIPQERLEDVIYFDPSYTERPMGLNMLEYDVRFPEQKTFVVNEMMSIFNKLFDMKVAGGPMFEQYFRNATMLVIDDPESGNTLLDVSRVLSDQNFRNMKISKCKNPTVVQFWTEIASKAGGEASLANIVPYITSKFDVFLSNDIMRPVIAQKESSFDFRKIMDEKKILLVNLAKGRLGDINSNLIGLIVVGKLLMAALSRVDSLGKDFPPFYLYIDEFQNITTDSISAILSEARKYKLSLCVAHQFIAQLQESIRDAVFGNVGSMAVFRVGAEDAKFLETQFAPRFVQKDIMNIENFNFYLKMLNEGVPVEPFNVKLPPKQEFDLNRVEDIKQPSYLKYGKDRGEVEEEIMKNLRKETL